MLKHIEKEKDKEWWLKSVLERDYQPEGWGLLVGLNKILKGGLSMTWKVQIRQLALKQ